MIDLDKHLGIKRRLTNEASADSFDAYFEYEEIEREGLMSCYFTNATQDSRQFTLSAKRKIMPPNSLLFCRKSAGTTHVHVEAVKNIRSAVLEKRFDG